MKRVFMFAVVLAIFPIYRCFSQIPERPGNIQSPNAASLGLYGDYQVSYFTGLPQIGIPLYTLTNGNVSIPISMNYHASGFRPDQHPGWVGLGWSLDAGGVINRTVHDLPDDFNNSNFYMGSQAGFYYNYGVLNTASWNSTTYMKSIAEGDPSFKDTEPDEFSFSLPDGGSGKFYRTHLGSWAVRSDRPYKVTFNDVFLNVPFTAPYDSPYTTYGYYKSFNGFTITDQNGVQYVFGGNVNAIEYNMPIFVEQENHWIAESWYLTKVIHPYGDVVTLDYARDSFISQMFISVNNNLGSSTVANGGIFDPQPSCSSTSYANIGNSYQGQLVSPVYLTTITAGSEQVKFNRTTSTELRYPQAAYDWNYTKWQNYYSSAYDTFLSFLEPEGYNTYPTCLNNLQWKKLDEIRVEVGGVLQKGFDFTYSNSTSQRLTLLSLVERGKSGGTLKPYTFTYNTSVALPGYLANKNDHWGFYNGTYADISNQSTYYNTYYNYRNPNATYLQAGTISRITYPTGGYTDFTFEPHYYRKQLQEQRELTPTTLTSNTLSGGLRIKKVSSYDPLKSDEKVEKEYFYVDGYTSTSTPSTLQSSGILGGQIRYWFNDYRTKAFNDNVTWSQSLFSSQSVLPGNYNSQGSHIGYSTVVEKRNDGSYSIFKFSNFDNSAYGDEAPSGSLQPTRNIYDPYTSGDLKRGKLLGEYHYTAADVLLQKKEISYISLNSANEQVRSLKARYFNVCPSTAVSVEEATAYRYYTFAMLPNTETTTQYDQNGANPLTTTRSMTYDLTYKLLKTETITDSKETPKTVSYRYAFDVSTGTPPATPTPDPSSYPVYWLKTHYNIGHPLEKVQTITQSGTEMVTSVDITTYGGTTAPSASYPIGQYRLNVVQPIAKSSYIPYTVNSASAAEPATIDTKLSLTGQFTYGSYSPTTGQYVLRLSENRPYRAPITSYVWGYGDKLPVSEARNTEQTEAAYSSFETVDKGNWTYSGTTTTDATAPTGNYVYNLSGGAISRTGLTSTKKYLLTYWAKSASSTAISGGTATIVRTYNGWTLYKRTVTGVTSISLTGSVAVDELRLHNLEGELKTYTYNDLGAITTETDGKGYTKYYTYDEFNRLVTVKDNDGHILEDYTYHLR